MMIFPRSARALYPGRYNPQHRVIQRAAGIAGFMKKIVGAFLDGWQGRRLPIRIFAGYACDPACTPFPPDITGDPSPARLDGPRS